MNRKRLHKLDMSTVIELKVILTLEQLEQLVCNTRNWHVHDHIQSCAAEAVFLNASFGWEATCVLCEPHDLPNAVDF